MDYGPRGFKFLMVSLLLMCYQLGWVIGTTMQVDKPICTSELVLCVWPMVMDAGAGFIANNLHSSPFINQFQANPYK